MSTPGINPLLRTEESTTGFPKATNTRSDHDDLLLPPNYLKHYHGKWEANLFWLFLDGIGGIMDKP